MTFGGKSTQPATPSSAFLICRQPTGDYLHSALLGVAEGEGHFGPDVGRSPLPICKVVQQVDQHVVVLQQRHATVAVAEGHVGPNGADVGVDLARVPRHVGLRRTHRSDLTVGSTIS